MSKRIPKETEKKIQRLFKGEIGLAEIARRTGVSYSSVYALTKLRQRINPETGRKYASLVELHDYQARQRSKRKKNKELSILIKEGLKKLNKNQSWLAEQLDISREAVSNYIKGESMPKEDNLRNLLKILEIKGKNKSKSIYDIVE